MLVAVPRSGATWLRKFFYKHFHQEGFISSPKSLFPKEWPERYHNLVSHHEVICLEKLLECLGPDDRVMVIERDRKDVVVSIQKYFLAHKNIPSWWKPWTDDAAIEDYRAPEVIYIIHRAGYAYVDDPRVKVFHYEDILASPELMLERMTRFFGYDFDEDLLDDFMNVVGKKE